MLIFYACEDIVDIEKPKGIYLPTFIIFSIIH